MDNNVYFKDYAMISDHTNPEAYLKTLSVDLPVDDIANFSGKSFDGENVSLYKNISVGKDTVFLGKPPVTDFTPYNTVIIKAKNTKNSTHRL